MKRTHELCGWVQLRTTCVLAIAALALTLSLCPLPALADESASEDTFPSEVATEVDVHASSELGALEEMAPAPDAAGSSDCAGEQDDELPAADGPAVVEAPETEEPTVIAREPAGDDGSAPGGEGAEAGTERPEVLPSAGESSGRDEDDAADGSEDGPDDEVPIPDEPSDETPAVESMSEPAPSEDGGAAEEPLIEEGTAVSEDEETGAVADPLEPVSEDNPTGEPEEEPAADEAGMLGAEASAAGPSGAGWKKVKGSWHYTNPKTKKPYKDGVFTIAGEKYCFDPSGAMVTGWMAIDGEVYWFDPATGAMATGCDAVIRGLCAPLAAAGGSSFKDVSSDTPHEGDIRWMYGSGISTGWVSKSGRTFRPMSSLARADMAAFLYRLAGSPEFVATEEDAAYFSDVDPDTPHATEIWWLASTGVSRGWEESNGSRTFRPLDDLARADMAAFLYRLAGSPSYKPTKKDVAYFSDVTSSTPHAREIRWLGSTGVSTGWREADGTRTFRPYDSLARADMAAFMHRMADEGVYEPAAEHTYRFDDGGALVTGWSGGSVFDSATGALVEAGWAKAGSKTYYVDPQTGKALKGGVHQIAGYSYCFDSKGAVRHGWIGDGAERRCFSAESGRMYAGGIFEVGSDSYCFNSKGALRYGLVKRGSATYYFDPKTGRMAHGWTDVDGERLFFDNSTGKLVKLRTTGNAELDRIIGEMVGRFGGNGLTSLRAVYDWVGDASVFPYKDTGWRPSGSWKTWSPQVAIDMYNNREGACYHYASLTGWFAYALGYDAEVIAGQTLFSDGWQKHGWVEMAYKGKTVVIDTQQHSRPWNANRNLFMITYDEAPLYYRTESGRALN